MKLAEKREHAGEQERDKAKARSKKPTSAVSMPCAAGALWGRSDVCCHSHHSKTSCAFLNHVVEIKQHLCLRSRDACEALGCCNAESNSIDKLHYTQDTQIAALGLSDSC